MALMRSDVMDNLQYANNLIEAALLDSRMAGAILTSIVYATLTVLLLACARRGSKKSVRESSLRQILNEGVETSKNASRRSTAGENTRTKRSVNSGSGPTEQTKPDEPKRDGNGRRPPRSRSSSLRVNSTQRSSSTGVIKMTLPSMPGVRQRSTNTSGTTRSEEPRRSSSLHVDSTQTITEAHNKRMDDEYGKIRELRRKLQRRLEREKRDKAERKRRSSDGKSDDDNKAKLPYGEASNRCRLAEASERKQRKSLVKKKKDKKRTPDSANSEKEQRQSLKKTSGHKSAKHKSRKSDKDKSPIGRDERHRSKPPRPREDREADEEEQRRKKKKMKSKRSNPDEPKSSSSSDGGKRRKKSAKELGKPSKRSKSHD